MSMLNDVKQTWKIGCATSMTLDLKERMMLGLSGASFISIKPQIPTQI